MGFVVKQTSLSRTKSFVSGVHRELNPIEGAGSVWILS